MLKVLFVEGYYGLSEDEIEYEIVEGRSLGKFVGIECVEDVGEEKRVWKYGEVVRNRGVYEKVFWEFDSLMESKGVELNEGGMIDGSFVIGGGEGKRGDENEEIKEGGGDKLWNENGEKKWEKDVDGGWRKKGDESF